MRFSYKICISNKIMSKYFNFMLGRRNWKFVGNELEHGVTSEEKHIFFMFVNQQTWVFHSVTKSHRVRGSKQRPEISTLSKDSRTASLQTKMIHSYKQFHWLGCHTTTKSWRKWARGRRLNTIQKSPAKNKIEYGGRASLRLHVSRRSWI
jgi:hypothetical protein